jgi:hypothetical protein
VPLSSLNPRKRTGEEVAAPDLDALPRWEHELRDRPRKDDGSWLRVIDRFAAV